MDNYLSKKTQKKVNSALLIICTVLVLYMAWKIHSEAFTDNQLAQSLINRQRQQYPQDSSTLPGASGLVKMIFA